jgi:hypothetical protein
MTMPPPAALKKRRLRMHIQQNTTCPCWRFSACAWPEPSLRLAFFFSFSADLGSRRVFEALDANAKNETRHLAMLSDQGASFPLG